MAPVDDWRPTASLDALRLRAELLTRVRQFFAAREFLEVETPLLSADTVVDRHLDPLSVVVPRDVRRPEIGRRMWLQTSPEFAMKRLLAAHRQAIYQVAKAFRADERGTLHNPEFTIVEWYRPGDDLAAGMKLLSDLAEVLLQRGAAETTTYRDAFVEHAGLDPLAAPLDELFAAVVRLGGGFLSNDAIDRDTLLDFLMSEIVAPQLGVERPLIVSHYPASQAALAALSPADPRTAERFELFVAGIELANGYHELLDADALIERARTNNAARAADGRQALPEGSRLVAAMRSGLPACAGCALGFDRVAMLAAGATSIDEVQAFPVDRA